MGFPDDRGMVASWLLRVVVAFAVFGLVIFDAGAMTVNYFGLDSSANDILYALRSDTAVLSNPTQLQQRAAELAAEDEAQLVRANVDSKGWLHVRIRRRAKTLLAQRFEALDDLTAPAVGAQTSIE